MKLRQELGLKLLPLPLLIQRLDLLTLPLLELRQTMEQEMEQNPFLEMEEQEINTEQPQLEKNTVQDYDTYQGNTLYDMEEEKSSPTFPTPAPTFKEILLFNMHLAIMDARLIKIGEYIVYELDENGYLKVPLKEIANALQEEEKVVENVLHIIQKIAPPGVGAQNLQECLLIQLNKQPGVPKEVIQIVTKYFKEFLNQDFMKIRINLGISEAEFQTDMEWLQKCNPKPANGFGGEVRHVLPDVVIKQRDNEWVVCPARDWIPKLKLSIEYQTLIKSISKIDLETNEYLKKKLLAAKFLLEGIEKRKKTIEEITKYIAKNIIGFLEHNTETIQLITLDEVGKAIGRNASTISRAIKGKWVETPYGLVEFKSFFSKGRIKEYLGVKKRMKELVDKEDKTRPLKDGQILNILKTEGNKLARTTVVKYRVEFNIPPAHKRKM